MDIDHTSDVGIRLPTLTDQLADLVLGPDHPDDALLECGRLPYGWAGAYCSLLHNLAGSSPPESFWDRRVVHSVHHVSFHLGFRYRTWAVSSGSHNPDTEALLGRLQLESELFFWGASADAGNTPVEDLPFVDLCLTNNPLLRDGPTDALLSQWRDEYRAALHGLRSRWADSARWCIWTVNAVRFASFCLDLALLSPEFQTRCDQQVGLDPGRIDPVLDGLSRRLHPPTVAVIRRWLCSSHLPRDSSGLPRVVAVDPNRIPLGARSASEVTLQTGLG